MGQCDGLAGAGTHTFPTCAVAAGVEPEYDRGTTSQGGDARSWREDGRTRGLESGVRGEEEPGGKANEERDGGAKEDIMERTQGGGPEKPGSGSASTGDGRTSIQEAECSGPPRFWRSVAFPGALKRPRRYAQVSSDFVRLGASGQVDHPLALLRRREDAGWCCRAHVATCIQEQVISCEGRHKADAQIGHIDEGAPRERGRSLAVEVEGAHDARQGDYCVDTLTTVVGALKDGDAGSFVSAGEVLATDWKLVSM
ncbi:hypothetical protein NDU88_006852 [Pleurodeles waltl]|uniref:Uncharacterized protein n=1 Tax=Pleurodeles waltl TaxID=8319 RepID=A0AAV7VS62_PLEWA|nr:hypothetical protein NDU88_006852 [Pleurodeles waltl]